MSRGQSKHWTQGTQLNTGLPCARCCAWIDGTFIKHCGARRQACKWLWLTLVCSGSHWSQTSLWASLQMSHQPGSGPTWPGENHSSRQRITSFLTSCLCQMNRQQTRGLASLSAQRDPQSELPELGETMPELPFLPPFRLSSTCQRTSVGPLQRNFCLHFAWWGSAGNERAGSISPAGPAWTEGRLSSLELMARSHRHDFHLYTRKTWTESWSDP